MFLQTLEDLYYKTLPLSDFDGNNIVFIENHAAVNQSAVKLLLQSQDQHYGFKAAEDEIVATSAIESIDFSRDSVRKILKGMAPKDEQENRIMGLKSGLEFIADTANKITEENLYKLYMMTVGNFLTGDDRLKKAKLYRHDTVYVVSDRVEHSGLDYKKVPQFMKSLIAFANAEDDINDLIKAAIIHFYIAFVHPYFDGNGRIARLVHLWFLIQKGYQSALFIPFSSWIEKSRKAYYDAYTTIEENKKISGKIDVTPFILYFINNVYNKMNEASTTIETLSVYANLSDKLQNCARHSYELGYVYENLAYLCKVLSYKSELGVKIKKAYDHKDFNSLQNIADNVIPKLINDICVFREKIEYQWTTENKIFGFEVMDNRIGGLIQRINLAKERINKFLLGKIEAIEELEVERLPFNNQKEENILAYGYTSIISVSGI